MTSRVYEHKMDGRRIHFPSIGYTAAIRSDVRFRRKVMLASKVVIFKVFGTLTYADEFLPYSSKHVSLFFKRWRDHNTRLKKKKAKVEYIWREDFGSLRGRPHYHFLVNDFEDIEKIRKWWGRGFVWVKKVYSLNEVRQYLYKYMCKKRDQLENNKRHRFGSSQGVPKTPQSDWRMVGFCREENLKKMVGEHNQNLGHLDMILGVKKI